MPDINSPVGQIYGSQNQPSQYTPQVSPEDEVMARGDLAQKIKDLGSYVRSLFEQYDGSATRKNILNLVAESRRAYYTESDTTDFPWPNASNMITPMTTMGVDEVEPRLVAAVIGREPYIKARRTIGASTKQEADAITKFDNFILEHKVAVKKIVPEMIHEELLDGTIYPLLSWETKTKKARRTAPDPQSPNGLGKTIVDVSSSGPQVTLVPIEFVWHADDINDEDWEEATVIRYLGNMTVGELKRRGDPESGEVGWMLPEDLSKYTIDSKSYKTTQQETEGVGDPYSAYSLNQKPIEFYEAYLKFDLLDDGIDENLIVLVEKETFTVFRIREQIDVIDENIKPLRRMRFLKRRGISWGYPLYTLIAGIQLGIDAMWNRCINSADITMTPWGFIKRGISGLRKNKIEVYPGNLVEIDNPEAVNFPNLTMFQPAQFVPLILQYVSFFERTLNVTDFMQGRESQVSGKKGTTATGTLAILQEGKIKFEYRGGLTHNEFLDFFKTIHDLCVSNTTVEEMVKICGFPITQYSSTEAYVFLLTGSDLTSNRFVDRQETESFVMTMQPFMTMLNPMTLIGDILNSYEKEQDDYINPELAAMVQQWMTIEQNTKAIEAMGLPPEIAKQAAEAGYSPENVETFIKQLGKSAGQTQFQPPPDEESKEKGEPK